MPGTVLMLYWLCSRADFNTGAIYPKYYNDWYHSITKLKGGGNGRNAVDLRALGRESELAYGLIPDKSKELYPLAASALHPAKC